MREIRQRKLCYTYLQKETKAMWKAKRAIERAKSTKTRLLKKYWAWRAVWHFKRVVVWSRKFRETAPVIAR